MTKVLSHDRVEARFGAMGREARVVVLGGPARLDERARYLIEVFERKWSRFRSGSEISRVNAGAGRAVVVSPETYGLVERAVGAWRVTDGRFDPSVGSSAGVTRGASPGCARVEMNAKVRSVQVPAGVQLDLSGIARGFAADLAVGDLARGGAKGALVSIGSDVRVTGEPPRPEGWFVDVDDPFKPGVIGRLRLREGAVCTWNALTSHPTGRDAVGVDRTDAPEPVVDLGHRAVAATVVAGEAWWAQAIAKAAVLAGPDAGLDLLAAHGVTGVMVLSDGEVCTAPGIEAFC